MEYLEIIEQDISNLGFDEKVAYINKLREFIHKFSPFKNEPVDFVKWEKSDNVTANDYNPNKVAPPEMELLEVSIMNDGYTQPIVTWRNEKKGKTEVIDGFHRNRVGKESKIVKQRIKGYLPVVDIRKSQSSKNDRIASTIRHNRARGKHQVDAMSEIVLELKNRNWTNKRIANQLGMDEEEVLRLCQISGLENLFSDRDFSRAWISSDSDYVYEDITDDIPEDDVYLFRTANTGDADRIFHTYDKWECNKAGFYATSKAGLTKSKCEEEFIRVITDSKLFRETLDLVITEWRYSCEQYLTNRAMNRIAWLGKAAVCYSTGIPAKFCSAWGSIPEEKQDKANLIALDALNKWLLNNNRFQVSLEVGLSIGRQVEIY